MTQRTLRSLLFLACVSSGLAAVARAQERPAFTSLDRVDWTNWKDLDGLLADIHARTGVPALAAAFVRDGQIVAESTIGAPTFGSPAAVSARAAFHLGSLTKSFTAVVIGKLIEDGKLDWNTSVGRALEGVEMQEAYRGVTLEELLQHRGGLPAYTDGRPPGHDPDKRYSGSPTEQRAAFLADVLALPPVGTPGQTTLYSNAGYALAGFVAERVTGESWEGLVRRCVFDPLGMSSAGFGFPERPQGHVVDGAGFAPVPLDAYPNMAIIAPAGNIHCCARDLARYALAHLSGLAGRDGWLRAETLQRLHTPTAGEEGQSFASGWIVSKDARGEPMHRHGGTVGASYAEMRLYPARQCGVIFLTNVPIGVGEALANEVDRALLQRYAPAPSGFVSAGPGEGATQLEVVAGGASAEQDARLWQLVREISEAINDEDRPAYRALFAASFDQRDADSMFDFMARNVLPARGGVHAFHALGPALKVPGYTSPMRTVTFHLENGFPGYFGFSLDEKGKIEKFSLFVKGDVCPNGADRHCAKIVKLLDEDFH